MGTKDIDVALKKEIAIADKYSKALNPYDSTEVHLSAVLSQEYIKSLESLKLRIKQVEYRLGKNVIETCRAVAQTVGEKKAEIYGKRLLGELIITNVEDDMLFSTKERNIIKKYDSQKAKAGNYPYQFSESPEIVMERIVKQTFNQTTTEENEIEIRQCLQIIGIVLCCCLGILVWFL